jgi:hypothetical protein
MLKKTVAISIFFMVGFLLFSQDESNSQSQAKIFNLTGDQLESFFSSATANYRISSGSSHRGIPELNAELTQNLLNYIRYMVSIEEADRSNSNLWKIPIKSEVDELFKDINSYLETGGNIRLFTGWLLRIVTLDIENNLIFLEDSGI